MLGVGLGGWVGYGLSSDVTWVFPVNPRDTLEIQ